MILKDRERAKVNSSDIKYLEKELDKIDIERKLLINEFDLNAEKYLGKEVIDYLVNLEDNNVRVFPAITSRVVRKGRIYKEAKYSNILNCVHKSKIKNLKIKEEYEKAITSFLSSKTKELKEKIESAKNSEEMNKYRAKAFALASIAIKQFHKKENMDIRDVQLLSSLAITNGDVAELATGEGKTIGCVPAAFFESLRGRGVHVITANSYLSSRDYEELYPIYNALSVSVGYVPLGIDDLARIENIDLNKITYEKKYELEKRLREIKKKAYNCDITYASKSAVSFDYLRDGIARCKDDYLEREYNPSFAIIDEIDDALIDDAQSPYILGSGVITYRDNMTYLDLASLLLVPVDSLLEKIGKNLNNAQEIISYDEAREISMVYYGREVVLNQNTYQKRCQRFFKTRIENNIYEIKDDNEFGLTKDDLYDLLTDYNKEVYVEGDKALEQKIRQRVKDIRENSYVIYYKDANKYSINDICYDEFLKYCYFAFGLNSLALKHKEEIINDPVYENGKDYNIVDDRIIMTNNGSLKLIGDYNHPLFVEDYKKHVNNMVPFSLELSHYLNKAVSANLIMRNGKDYIVKNNRVYILKGGRIQPDSSYTAGLQRAVELKEGIESKNQRQEIESALSITQKEFYDRYDCFAGLTGTSNKRIFKEIFGKNTIEIPRDAFYRFYSSRLRKINRNSTKEPEKIIKKDTRFTATTTEKIRLIVDSVKKSLALTPASPVLIALSNPEEMTLLSKALLDEGIENNILSASVDKSKEAEIISKAGLAGAVTITTEMAGRGTDIKLGGDRDTIIEIALTRQIKNMEEKAGRKLNLSIRDKELLRKRVEDALVNYSDSENRRYLWTKEEEEKQREELSKNGLKVITSGFFNVERVDRQLEGRCGRDGVKGVTEKYASLADLERLGVTSIEYGKSLSEYFKKFPKRKDGAFDIDKKSFDKINEKIRTCWINNEEIIKERIINSQEISRYSSSTLKKLKDERKDIIYDNIDIDASIAKIYENALDDILRKYIKDDFHTSLLYEILENSDSLDYEYFKLEVKEVFGIELDIQDIKRNKVRPLELRNGILSYIMNEREKEKEKDYEGLYEKEKSALLNANSYIISNINSIYEKSLMERNMSTLSFSDMALELKTINLFNEELDKVRLDASKMVVRNINGVQLNKYEKEILKEFNDKKDGISIVRDDDKKRRLTRSRTDFIEKLSKARKKLEKRSSGYYAIKMQGEEFSNLKNNIDNKTEIDEGAHKRRKR